MKNTLTALLLFCSLWGFSQNTPPLISSFSATVDTSLKLISIQYNVSDAENELLHIYLKASDEAGFTYLLNTSSCTGDIGPGITPGSNKLILWDYSQLTAKSESIKLRLIADDNYKISGDELVFLVDSLRMKTDMSHIEGTRNYIVGAAHLKDVKDTIHNRFYSLGLQVRRQQFSYNNYQAENIIGKKQGLVDEGKLAIIDGHFDCVSEGPGADDNGSAVVAMLEAARILSKYEFRNSINFIGFDLEENGLLGSREYVKNGIKPYEKVEGVLNFEMIGYYSELPNSQIFPQGFNMLFPDAYQAIANNQFRGNFITNVGNVASTPLLSMFHENAQDHVPALKVVSIAVPGKGTIAPDLRRSDHAPFWDTELPALMLTDGANFRNKNYHTNKDVSDSLNFTFMSRVTAASIATIAQLADIMHCDVRTIDIEVPNFAVGLESKKLQKGSMGVSPNPSSSESLLSWSGIHFKVSEILLRDISGKLVYRAKVNEGMSSHTLFTEAFENGTYTVSVAGEGKELSKKILIKH